MLLKLVRYVLAALVLLLVFLASALIAMRYAIQGREVRVPALIALTPAEAERSASSAGLILSIDSRFYSSRPQGRIVSQTPEAGAHVRRGWRIIAAESLGPQRAAIPNVVGQSEHAADTNITRRGLEVGSIAVVRLPGAQSGTVLAQNPRADNKQPMSPRISLLVAALDNSQLYVMPSFVGKPVTRAAETLRQAGFTLGKVSPAIDDATQRGPGIIVRQYPAAGQKVAASTTINFEVSQ